MEVVREVETEKVRDESDKDGKDEEESEHNSYCFFSDASPLIVEVCAAMCLSME